MVREKLRYVILKGQESANTFDWPADGKEINHGLGWSEHIVSRMGEHGVLRMGENGVIKVGEHGVLTMGENGVCAYL